MDGAGEENSLDLRGKSITTFIAFESVQKLKDMDDGAILEILTDDSPAIENDIKAWCRITGNKLSKSKKEAGDLRLLIEKGIFSTGDKVLAMVISDAGLEELLSPLGFALGAALEGIEVHIYFQGPAIRVLKKGFRAKLKGIKRPFSIFAEKGMEKVGHLPAQQKLKQLGELGAHLYACGPSMEHFKVSESEFAFDDISVAEYLTFMEVMSEADIHIYV